MKKLVAVLSIVMILLTSVALAQDYATPTDIRATPTDMRAVNRDMVQRPSFDTFGEALKAEPADEAFYNDKFCATIVQSDGVYYRFVAKYDKEAKNLWNEAQKADPADGTDPMQAFQDYINKLPVKYDGEFTEQPLEQGELEKLIGKTVAEAKKAGYSFIRGEQEESTPEVTCGLTKGYFSYLITLNESYDVYQEHDLQSSYDDLTIQKVTFTSPRFSARAWGI